MIVQVITPIWGRKETVKHCFIGLDRLRRNAKAKGIEVRVHAIISEDWPTPLCQAYDFTWNYHDNKPLGAKLNSGVKHVMQYKWDWLMPLGSDNLLSDALWDLYQPYIDKGYQLIGFDKCHFLRMEDMAVKIVDYNFNMIAGRIVKRESVELVCCDNAKVQILVSCAGPNYSFDNGQITYLSKHQAMDLQRAKYAHIVSTGHVMMWPEDAKKGLDTKSNLKLRLGKVKNSCIDPGNVCYMVDLKTEDNLWKFDSFTGKAASLDNINIPEIANILRKVG